MTCNFEKICLFLEKRLNLGGQLEVLDHLDKCDICLEAACRMIKDRDPDSHVRHKINDRLIRRSPWKRRIRAYVK